MGALEIIGFTDRKNNSTYAELVEGQTKEIQLSFNFEHGINDYIDIVKGKTASLIRTSAKLGAIASECENDVVEAISEWALNAGIVFQISDDILDITSNPNKLGKPVGNDILEGTYTLPVHIAMQKNQSLIVEKLQEVKEDNTKIENLLEILRSDEILSETREIADQHSVESQKSLETLRDSSIYEVLIKINTYLIQRTY